MFRKFKLLVTTNFQELVEYKGDVLIYTVSALVLPLILMNVWLTVGEARGFSGSEKQYVVQYFFVQMILSVLISAWQAPFLSERIKRGDISAHLLKPIGFLWFYVAGNLGEKIWKILFSFPAIFLIGYMYRDSLCLAFEGNVFLIIPVIAFAASINFLIEQLIGMAAFWTSSVRSINNYNDMIFYVTSGKLFPLKYIGNVIPLGIINILPYKYILGFPIDVVLGKVTSSELLQGVFMQVLWIGTLILLYKFLWSKGLKRYGGYGL